MRLVDRPHRDVKVCTEKVDGRAVTRLDLHELRDARNADERTDERSLVNKRVLSHTVRF